LCFLTLGFVLEVFHGFKIRWYLDVSNDTRRLMWTLAHSHGTLLALINLGFGLTVRTIPEHGGNRRALASKCLLLASLLLPTGFFLGGITIHSGDPGLGILLVPIGAILLFAACLLTAIGIGKPAAKS